jgi:hypothetical protein
MGRRIEVDEDEFHALKRRVEALEGKTAVPAPPPTVIDHGVGSRVVAAAGETRPIGRRALLGKAGAVLAAGTGLALIQQSPALAGTDGDVVLGGVNNAGNATTTIQSGDAMTLDLISAPFYNNRALSARGGAEAIAASGRNGPGLVASSTFSNGIDSTVFDVNNPYNAVYGHVNNDKANGVFGEQQKATGAGSGVLGISKGTGNSVFGYKPSNAPGHAVVGVNDNAGLGVNGISAKGRGGAFAGKAAAVRLVPTTAATHPSSGLGGDLYVDTSKRLWFCKGGTTWVQIV